MRELLEKESIDILREALGVLEDGFASLPAIDSRAADPAAMRRVLAEVATRMRDNYPYFHPLYAGQMLKPPHPIARAAAALADWINPNNHALDGGRASSRMEHEAVSQLAAMFGWQGHLGHLTGGGTMANLEALWVAARLHPGKRIIASEQAHYTHGRISGVLGLAFTAVACDAQGRLDIRAVERELAAGEVGTVVATIGCTATGAVDPLAELLALRGRHDFRIHADAAYGGYFVLSGELRPETRRHYDRLGEVDSIVVDPHKHGLQPYGCGCVIFRDPTVGRFYRHDSPYTYFTSSELHLGEISLECSRPGAAAVALWATQRLLPLERGGEFARSLDRCRRAAATLHARISADGRFVAPFGPELDIVVWAPRARSVQGASQASRAIFAEAARRGVHLALADLPAKFFDLDRAGMARDADTVTCLRSVLMKPEHADWVERIWETIAAAADAALSATAPVKP